MYYIGLAGMRAGDVTKVVVKTGEDRNSHDIESREKQIKGLLRVKKMALIVSMNPEWRDLSEDWGKPFGLAQALTGTQKA